jgi:hypothetical protein
MDTVTHQGYLEQTVDTIAERDLAKVEGGKTSSTLEEIVYRIV